MNASEFNWNDSEAKWKWNVKDTNNNATDTIQPPYNWSYLALLLPVLIGVLGNVLVCLSVSLDKRLHNVTNYFLLSLAVADLFVCVVAMPFDVLNKFYGMWPLGWQLCTFWVSCDVLSCTASVIHMCFISLDRYLGVRKPLHARVNSRRTILFKIICVWLVSMTITSPITILAMVDTHNIEPEPGICAINHRYFMALSSLFSFYIPSVIMVTSYLLTVQLLYKKTKFCQPAKVTQKAKQIIEFPSKSSSTSEPSQDPVPRENQVRLNNRNWMSRKQAISIKTQPVFPGMIIRVSSGRNQLKNEQKASKVLGLIFFIFIICWTPFSVLCIFIAAWGREEIPEYLVITCVWLGYISSTINPFIYTIFNRRFKRAFWIILSCKCQSIQTIRWRRATNDTISKSTSRTSIDHTSC